MTAKEIVAKWIETEWFSHDPAISDIEEAIVAGLVADIEQAITASATAAYEACEMIANEYTGVSTTACRIANKIHARSAERTEEK